jgi:hypothetical protein
MRLIDADALFNWGKYKLSDAVKYGNKDEEHQDFSYSTLMMYEIAGEVDDAPTIDAVLVVRCKDCKQYNTTCCSEGLGWCEKMDRGVHDDFYCSNGERKESEGST